VKYHFNVPLACCFANSQPALQCKIKKNTQLTNKNSQFLIR